MYTYLLESEYFGREFRERIHPSPSPGTVFCIPAKVVMTDEFSCAHAMQRIKTKDYVIPQPS